MSTIDDFCELFAGNESAFGTEEGSSARGFPPVADHLAGHRGVGVYPMVLQGGTWTVGWGCVDLDIAAPGKRRYDFATSEGAAVKAKMLCGMAKQEGVVMWPECTRSGGYHVWLFAEQWVPAETMRKALVVLCGMSNTPITEVNPKQFSLPLPSSLGNYVRLPYFGNARPILAPRTWQPLMLDEFCHWALRSRTSTETLTGLAEQWLPVKPLLPTVGAPVEVDAQWLGALPPYLRTILRDGMGKATDRSGWLFYLAKVCQSAGLTTGDALSYVQTADSLHSQKYSERADAEERYSELVQRAYGEA